MQVIKDIWQKFKFAITKVKWMKGKVKHVQSILFDDVEALLKQSFPTSHIIYSWNNLGNQYILNVIF